MITDPQSIKQIEDALRELQKKLGIDDDEDFSETDDDDDFNYDNIRNDYGVDLKELEVMMTENTSKVAVKVNKIHSDSVFPNYNYGTDSGFDFYATEDVEIGPFGRALVPTGLRFDLPPSLELQVRSKSGLALKDGLMVLNSPGTVDNGYTGEVKIIIFNTNQTPYKVTKGMKIAQGVFAHVIYGDTMILTEVDNIIEKDRNENGFGSTGR
jgi:dUTP pyrophosphatase